MKLSRWLVRSLFASLVTATISIYTTTPAVAQAQLSYVVDATTAQSFSDLMQQAETVATEAIARAFAQNPALTAASITVGADRSGTVSPLLTVRVSRREWQSQPSVQVWARYLPISSRLLGFEKPSAIAVAASPAVAPVAPISRSAATGARSAATGPVTTDNEPNFYK